MAVTHQEIKKHLGSTSPLVILDKWLKRALKIKGLEEPWAMVLSTSFKNRASSRVLLLKKFQKGKLFFYSNYLSSKGEELKNNAFAAVNFYWPQTDKQIRIEGRVKRVSRRDSVSYWKTRSRSSQISQWISRQSQEISSRKELEDLKAMAEEKFQGKDIPCPKHWGGYALQIERIEFWKNRDFRLHDRFLFEKKGRGWKVRRLFP